MKNTSKLLIILAISLCALILEFGLHLNLCAQILITIVGSLISLSMLIEMIKTLRSGQYGIDLLAITAVVATLLVSEYWASMVVLIMLVGGESLEDYAAKKANTELKALLDNTPNIAHRIIQDKTSDLAVEDVLIGDTLIVKPGELVPVDGHIIKGQSTFDESSLTGESIPITKTVGQAVMSGSLNGDASIIMLVDKLAKDSQYQRLIALVKKAQETPARFVRLADRYAVPFTLVAYLIALIAWFISKDPVRFAEVLVVASPCPLILAAPVALVSGMSRSSRNGIVVKTGDVLEKLATAKSAAFDKTGTITDGHLTVNEVVALNGHDHKELLKLAASSEQASTHILARSLVKYAIEQNIELLPSKSLTEVTGNGVKALIGTHCVKVGKLNFVLPENNLTAIKQTTSYVAIDNQLWGYITFCDHIRPEAKKTMQTLRKEGINDICMLTGDQAQIAHKIAKQADISEVFYELLPEDKINIIKTSSKTKRPLIMVGDGVNDAPALALADVGIAMGAHGSTAASESADVVILKDDLTKVTKAIKIAKDTLKIAKQSVLIGIAICIFLMLIASTGIIPAFLGAMFQEVIDTVSILWALKARFSKEKAL